jgi:hypothetical protein
VLLYLRWSLDWVIFKLTRKNGPPGRRSQVKQSTINKCYIGKYNAVSVRQNVEEVVPT